MAISIDNLPFDANGGLDGMWMLQLRQNLNGGHGGAEFRDGRTVTPMDSRTFRQFVAAMGHDIVGATRVMGSPCDIGDVSSLRPTTYDEIHSKSLDAQDSNKLVPGGIADTTKGEAGDNPALLHTLAGAKFETPEQAKSRKAFAEAGGQQIEQTAGGGVVVKTAGAQGTQRSGGEPTLDPNAPLAGEAAKPPEGAVVDGAKLPDDGPFVDATQQQDAKVEGAPQEPHDDGTKSKKGKRW